MVGTKIYTKKNKIHKHCNHLTTHSAHSLKLQDIALQYSPTVSPSPTGDYTVCPPCIALCWPTPAHPLLWKLKQPTSCLLVCEHLYVCRFLVHSICLLAGKACSQMHTILDRFTTYTEMCIHALFVQFVKLWIHTFFLKTNIQNGNILLLSVSSPVNACRWFLNVSLANKKKITSQVKLCNIAEKVVICCHQ